MNPNISKMHKALVFLHYCLERYDCFSIYKIESVRFNFLKFCMQNTAVAYLCRRALLPASSIHNWVYVILHGRKQQLSWSFTKKKSIRYTEIKNPGAGERNQWIQEAYLSAASTPCTYQLHTLRPAGLRRAGCAEERGTLRRRLQLCANRNQPEAAGNLLATTLTGKLPVFTWHGV